MDYLEGILLHSWWTDTDYESRKHTGTWLWYSVFSFLVLLVSAFSINYLGRIPVIDKTGTWSFFTIVLFLITPFLCMIYYRVPFFIRIPILAVLGLKYISAFFWAIAALANFFILPEWITFQNVLVWGNETFGNYLEDTTAEMGVTGLFYGGGVIVLIAIVITLIVLALAIIIPIFLLKIFNLLQFYWDKIFIIIFSQLKKLYQHYKSDPSAGKFIEKSKNPQTRSKLSDKISKTKSEGVSSDTMQMRPLRVTKKPVDGNKQSRPQASSGMNHR